MVLKRSAGERRPCDDDRAEVGAMCFENGGRGQKPRNIGSH